MASWRYEISLHLSNLIFPLFAALTCEMSSCTLDEKLQIPACSCIILYYQKWFSHLINIQKT